MSQNADFWVFQMINYNINLMAKSQGKICNVNAAS